MELRELRSFCAAAKLRNMSKASEALGIGQPTVTKHVKNLEEELGIVLFDRMRRPIQLTTAGVSLAQLAMPLVEGIDELAAKASDIEEEGPVRVASTHDFIPHTLLRAVMAYREVHPQVHLRIRSGSRREVLEMVEEGEVDIGVVPGPERSENLDFHALFPYERVLITPPGHPLLDEPLTSLEQIAAWPLILMGPRTYTRLMLETEFRRSNLPYEIVVELDSMDMAKRYVALGMGVSVGPRLAIEPEDERLLGVVSLVNILPTEQAGILTLRGKKLAPPARGFIQEMERTLIPAGIRS